MSKDGAKRRLPSIFGVPCSSFDIPAEGVYLPEGRQPIIPLFHHSIIPIVSAANQVLISRTGLVLFSSGLSGLDTF